MKTLDDAWNWYQSSRHQLRLMRRLADRYWADLPWDSALGRDGDFRLLEGPELVLESEASLGELDDLAVMVLFSVFEAVVRDRVLRDIEPEVSTIRHPALRLSAVDALRAIEEGSFFRVLEPFKSLDAALVEEINQVRRYRNHVAHGKRGAAPPTVDPRVAYDRLGRFLDLLDRSGIII